MFKFKSYNVKKTSKKNEKQQPSSSTATAKATATASATASATTTLKKPSSKEKKKPSPNEIKHTNNKQSPEYSRKIYPKKTVTEWHNNKTFSAKNETKKVVIPTPHKKLERK